MLFLTMSTRINFKRKVAILAINYTAQKEKENKAILKSHIHRFKYLQRISFKTKKRTEKII